MISARSRHSSRRRILISLSDFHDGRDCMMTDTPLLFSRRTPAASPDDIPLDWEIHHSDAAVLTLADGTMAPPQIATSVRSLWNDRFLFILFAGHFQRLRLMPEPGDLLVKTPELWNHSDVFETFLGVEARSTGCYFEFQVAPDGRWLDLAIDRAKAPANDETWVSGLRCRAVNDTAERHVAGRSGDSLDGMEQWPDVARRQLLPGFRSLSWRRTARVVTDRIRRSLFPQTRTIWQTRSFVAGVISVTSLDLLSSSVLMFRSGKRIFSLRCILQRN